jgi:hypothetical protein
MDMFLEDRALPSVRIHKGQFLGKRAATLFASEATCQEMQKRPFAPNIQVADAPLFFLMECR